jgi:hypothetical protein
MSTFSFFPSSFFAKKNEALVISCQPLGPLSKMKFFIIAEVQWKALADVSWCRNTANDSFTMSAF